MNTLAVIPTYMRSADDLEVTRATLESIRAFEPDVDILVVDDCSPADWAVDLLGDSKSELNFDVHKAEKNSGFSTTVNVGLELALRSGRNAALINADISCLTPWVELMESQVDSEERPAAVVGALLAYPTGMLIQHAGVFYSLLRRDFNHRFHYAPFDLPEAHQTFVCPVTGAFQFIRHSTLETVGLYDTDFKMGWEDVDYCLRVFEAGLECIYQPKVQAIHHESLFRGAYDRDPKLDEWTADSFQTLLRKWRGKNLARFIPEIV